jgi:hypothetical protein
MFFFIYEFPFQFIYLGSYSVTSESKEDKPATTIGGSTTDSTEDQRLQLTDGSSSILLLKERVTGIWQVVERWRIFGVPSEVEGTTFPPTSYQEMKLN